MAQASGFDAAWIAPAGTSGTPGDGTPSAAWDALGRVKSGEGAAVTVQTETDAMNRPVYASALLDVTLEMLEPRAYSNAAQYEGDSPCVVAVRKPSGAFILYTGVYVTVRYNPGNAAAGTQTARLRIQGAAHRVRTLQSAETAATP